MSRITLALLAITVGCDLQAQDCPDDDKVLAFADNDGDTYGKAALGRVCTVEPGMSTNNIDCNDTVPEVFPGAEEACDGLDNNCDGVVDDGFVLDTYFADFDGDGFGDDFNVVQTCQNPGPDWVLEGGDCDDSDSRVSPNNTEICGNGLDDNCDSFVDSGPETCDDGFDNNCNGLVDCDDPGCLGFGNCLAECADEPLPTALPIMVFGSTSGEQNDFAGSCGLSGVSPDYAYQYVATIGGTYVFDTFGSGYDTVLQAWDLCDGPEIICNDDAQDLQSEIQVELEAGQGVIIVVSGFNGSNGSYSLNARMQ